MMVFYYFWDYAIILPAAFFCILPVLQHSKIKPRLLLPLTSATLLITAAALAALRSLFAPDPNILLLGALVPMLLLYLLLFDVQKCRLGYIFLCGIAVFSFGGTATHYVQAVLNTEHEYLIACAVKWAISLLFLLAEVLSLKKLRWTINNENISSVWKCIWVVPLIITAANFFLIPSDYANVLVGRAFPLYVMFETVLVLFFIIFIIMKYVIARAITNKAEAEQNAQLLGMQAAQYEKLKKYLDNTAQMRHDFFYMAKTAQALAANNETEELKKLLSDYGAQIDSESSPRKYCENTALNAITAYYAEEAERQHIAFTARLNVAQSIMISDYELCSIVGNILDNSVAAASDVDGDHRRILFVADTKPNGDLYLAVSNPYSGAIRRKGSRFSSTKRGGHGIGLESVRAIVKKNSGYCNFRYDGSTFYSEIMLRQNGQ